MPQVPPDSFECGPFPVEDPRGRWVGWLREVARGERGARDLSPEQAREAARLMLAGRVSDSQMGAFLAAERMKGESADELAAFTEVLAETAVGRVNMGPGVLDCAGPHDGRVHSFAATIPAAAILAAAGVPVFLHASDRPSAIDQARRRGGRQAHDRFHAPFRPGVREGLGAHVLRDGRKAGADPKPHTGPGPSSGVVLPGVPE
ncbi:MAG: hypothetical protein K6T30_09590, partial [Alicyclobacillus sp.]|nr:hypothetical protein [Alicyclobacillus sp.]